MVGFRSNGKARMVVHVVPLLRQADDSQQARNGAGARCQNGSQQRHLGMTPTAPENSGAKLGMTVAKRDGS
jgi:hypothetical protein